MLKSCSLLILGVTAAVPSIARPQARDTTVTAFVHVAVIPMDRERVLQDQTVVVRGSRIVALGPATIVAVPAGAAQIDGRGKFLLPGLADMHSHNQNWFAFLANGITTVRNPGGPPGAGEELRAAVAATGLPGPHVYSFGTVDVSSPADAVESVQTIKAAGDDAIKLEMSAEPGEVYDSILAAARRVHLPIVGHVPGHRPLEAVLASGQWASIEHLTGYFEYVVGLSGRWDIGEAAWLHFDHQSFIDTAAWMRPTFDAATPIRRIAAATRRAGVWNCPTLSIIGGLLAGLDEINTSWAKSPAFRRTTERLFDIQLQLTKALHDAGAGLLLGNDDNPFGIHQELQLLVRAGLTPYEALETGTRNAATFLGTLDSAGTVAVGKQADLLLLNSNPLTDITATAGPAGVMMAGHWFPRAEIEARLDSLGLTAAREDAWRHNHAPTPAPSP